MRTKFIALLTALALLMSCAAWAEENGAGETVIEPFYPVPDYVTMLLEVAVQEIGYTEASDQSTKYGSWAGDPYAEWCAEYVCWCVNQTDVRFGQRLLSNVYPNYSSSNIGRNWFLSQGRYIARRGIVPGWGSQWYTGQSTLLPVNDYIPQPGDLVFFSNNDKGDTSHVALVEYCVLNADGGVSVHVLEGNNPNSVARKAYPLDYWMILGYGTVHEIVDITLRFGNDGEKVKKLQRALVAVGLLDAQYVTGKYGAITQQCIKDYQLRTGLIQTGVATQDTQLALYRDAGM